MKKIKILIPKIRPPDVDDITTFQIKAIINELDNDCEIEQYWLIFQPKTLDTINNKNFHQINYQDYDDAIDVLEKIKPDVVLVEGILGINGISFSLATKFLKIPMISLFTTIGNFGSEKKWFRIFSTFRFLSLNKFGGDIKKEKKSFQVLRYSFSRYRFLLKTLKNMNYNIFQIISFVLFYPRVQIFSRTKHTIHKIMNSDVNICPNKDWSKKLSNLGFDESKISIVGNPSFDLIFKKFNTYSKVINDGKIKVLFCTSPMHEHGHWSKQKEFELIKNILKIVSKMNKIKISVKIHPSTSNLNEYYFFLNDHLENVSLYQKEDIVKLVQENDLIITYGDSSVSLYGVLLKKRMIYVNLSSLQSWNIYFDPNLMLECKNIHNLPELITKILTIIPENKFYEKYIDKHLGTFDGNSSKRIADNIIQLIEHKKN
jgi:hypothetical protein